MVKMGEISPLHDQSVGPPWPLSFPVEVIHGYGYSGYGKPQAPDHEILNMMES